jgi:outer membrane receptor for ferrienterochelin and colicins
LSVTRGGSAIAVAVLCACALAASPAGAEEPAKGPSAPKPAGAENPKPAGAEKKSSGEKVSVPPSPAKAPAETPAEKAIDVVVTGTRTAESSRRSPVRTDVVTREEAERRGAADVGEALSGQLGVQVNPSAYGFLGNPSAIQIQGFDRDRVLILEDGERVVGDVGGAIDLASIPLTDVSRIELVTGPTSSLYGTSAIGGVVNILSAAPEAEGPSARARIEGRSRFGLVMQGTGAYRHEDKWAAIDASYQRSDGVALSSELPDLTIPDSSRSLVGLRAGINLGDRITLRIRGRWIHDDLMGLESRTYPGLKKTYLVDLPEKTDRFTLHLMETISLGEGADLKLMLGRQQYEGTTIEDLRDSDAGETRARSDVMHSFEAIGTLAYGRTTWTLGARAEAEHFEQQLTSIKPSSMASLETTELSEVPRTNLGSGALYGQLAWRITDSITVLAGSRGELHLRYGGVIAPRLAAMWSPVPPVVVRVSGGRGFRAPSAKEFGFSFDHSYYGYIVEGNPNLVPETSWGLNGDVSVTPAKRLVLRAGVFTNWIRELIDIDLEPVATKNGAAVYQYRNIGEARTAGFQADASWRVLPELRVEAGYAYLWTRDDTNERPLEGRPPHTVYSAMTATLPWKLELYLRWRAVTDAFIDETARSPGFETFDARLARELWPKSQILVGVTNLLDVKKDPARLGDQRPIIGRTVYAGLRAELPWGE